MGGKGKGAGKGAGKAAGKAAGKGKGTAADKAKGKGKGKDSAAPRKWTAVKPTCLVTGASGFVAGALIKTLLDKKYKVRGTVRSLADESKVKPLNDLFPGLVLVEANLLDGVEAFAKAMEGVTYVFHTASPFQLSCDDAQKDFVDPALKGTEAVVSAAVKAGVQRIVVTSSCAAIGPPQPWCADPTKADLEKVFTEEDWNTTSSLTEGPYRFSKRVAEEKAMELVKGSETSLTVVCPSFVIGPMMTSRADAASIKFIKDMLDGTMQKRGCSGGAVFGVVDVRDLAIAHVRAIETPEAGGKRFICGSEIGYGQLELCDLIRKRFQAYALPTEGKEVAYKAKYSNEQATKVLKVRFRKPEQSMRDMALAAIRLGIVEKKVLLKQVTFGKVGDVNPDGKGLNLLVKVLSVSGDEETKTGMKIREVVAGDATGVITLRLVGDEVAVAEVGKVVEIRNAAVKMSKGHVRLQVGKWGKVVKHEGDTEVTPKESNDVSATEYELVGS